MLSEMPLLSALSALPWCDRADRQIHSDMLAHLLELWEKHDHDKDDQM
jgi:hypothetical protein